VVFYAVAGPARIDCVPSSTLCSAASLRDRVQHLKPALPQSAPLFKAAVLLLAAQQVGQNVDRLARFTGYPREFIAKRARRLCDNGVWQDGRTVSIWSVDSLHENAFWADAGVAEGTTCRRIGDNGTIEWARAGVWTKSYDYGEKGSRLGLSVQYFDSLLNGPAAAQQATEQQCHACAEDRTVASHDTAGHTVTISRPEQITPTSVSPRGWSSAAHSDRLPGLSALPELFADAIWLS